MSGKRKKAWGVTLAVLAVALNFTPWDALGGAAAGDAVQTAAFSGRVLIPGGQAVGVALRTQGVLVVAKGAAGHKTPLREGDVILRVDGTQVTGTAQLAACIAKAKGEEVLMRVLRGEKEIDLCAPAPVEADGKRRLGVWVRDSTAGVGTLSYIDPQTGAYGALGHAIVDADTGHTLAVQDGALLHATVVGVVKGESGKAGELKGNFLKAGRQIGTLQVNGAYGIYGTLKATPQDARYPEGLPVGTRNSVHPGPATIISTVGGTTPQEYAVEIMRCIKQDAPSQKGMVLRVTDERLLEKTGGIVQGMSGSPIVQDGCIVGAVTHVYLSDSAQGYGMYIEWMLEQSDQLGAANTAA